MQALLLGLGMFLVVSILYARSRFWMRQPVRSLFERPQLGLVKPKQWTKYCDARVTTFQYDAQPVDAVVEFVQKHAAGYLNASHVRAYLPGAHISVFVDVTLAGVLVSCPVQFTVAGSEQPAEMYEFWVGQRLESLMCTHEFNRPATPALFSSETPIPLLVPVVKYPIYWVDTSKYRKHRVTPTKVNAASILTLRHRLTTAAFACKVHPPLERLLTLIELKVISVYCTPHTTLIFKNTMHVDAHKSVLDLVGVIGKSPDAYAAFASLMYAVRETYGWVRIHGLSDFASVHRKEPSKTSMRHVYAYNYYAPRTPPDQCLLI